MESSAILQEVYDDIEYYKRQFGEYPTHMKLGTNVYRELGKALNWIPTRDLRGWVAECFAGVIKVEQSSDVDEDSIYLS